MLGRTNPRTEELKDVALFAGCTPRELKDVARLSDDVKLPAGSVLMREGETGHEIFVIAEGEAVVSIDGEEIARVGPGEIVGEMAALDQEPRVATVVAATPLRAVVMSNLQFAAVTDHSPAVAMEVMAILTQRLREAQAA